MASSLRVDESGLGFGLPIGFGQGAGAGAGDWINISFIPLNIPSVPFYRLTLPPLLPPLPSPPPTPLLFPLPGESPRAKAHRRASIDALNDNNDESRKDNNNTPSTLVDSRTDIEDISVRAITGGGAQPHSQHRQHRFLSKKPSSLTVGFDLESSALDLLHGPSLDSPGGGGGRSSPTASGLRNPLRKNYGSDGTMFGSSVFGSSGEYHGHILSYPLSQTLSAYILSQITIDFLFFLHVGHYAVCSHLFYDIY